MANYPVEKSITDVNTCITNCLDANMLMPTLILIYSAIDGAAWLSHAEDDNKKEHFINWVNEWIMPQKKLNCTAIDLYAARCALLHTYTSKARLTRQGDAKQMCYVYGKATVKEMHD